MRNIECWICGGKATRTRTIHTNGFSFWEEQPNDYVRCYCDKCREKVEQTEKEERELYIRLKKREMFRKACKLLEDQNTRMYEYKEAIEVVRDHLENNLDKFDSSYEVLAAIVLVHNRIYSKMQQKVGRYQVDFLLPELFVVLEIDGDRHVHRKAYDTKIDIEIQQMLGDGWDIIRIKTDYLDMNAKKLPEAIYKTIEYRQTGKVNWREL